MPLALPGSPAAGPGRRRTARGNGGPGWMITLVDLVSLMLAFFVMRFAMTSVDSPKFEETAASISIALGTTVAPPSQEAPPEPLGVESARTGRGFRLSYLEPLLAAKLARDPLLRGARIARSGDRLSIALPADLLFDTGRAALGPEAAVAVAELATALTTLPNRIEVVGHADPRPFAPGAAFDSNRALSLARADAVAVALVEGGLPHMPTVVGMGDSRFRAVAPTEAMDTRYALARRVEVVVLPERTP